MGYYRTPHGMHLETDYPDADYEPISRAEYKRGCVKDAHRELKALLKPNATVYTKVEHVSRSGMSREISLYIVHKGRILNISHHVAERLERETGDSGGVKIGGCGMDMGFALVYDLGRALWPKGTRKAHGTRNGEPDHDGGYALNQTWL